MKIEVGTILIATDPRILLSFTVGKEYPISKKFQYTIFIIDDQKKIHPFDVRKNNLTYYGQWFKLKKNESSLNETERLQLMLEGSRQQAHTALVNAFSTIEAFAVPSYTPIYEGYAAFREYLLEMYEPK